MVVGRNTDFPTSRTWFTPYHTETIILNDRFVKNHSSCLILLEKMIVLFYKMIVFSFEYCKLLVKDQGGSLMMTKFQFFSTLVSALVLLTTSTSEAVQLNENGWFFPLSRYNDWKGTSAVQKKNTEQLAVISCQRSSTPLFIRSKRLKTDLSLLHLPDWDYSEMTLPAEIAPEITSASLKLFAKKRKNQSVIWSFVMAPSDGIRRTYVNKILMTKDQARGSVKFSELDNIVFTCQTSQDTKLKFGDLQAHLRGKTRLIPVPIVDAAMVDAIPSDDDWKNAPTIKELKPGVKTGIPLKAPTTIKFLHDAQCIYVHFKQETDTSKLVSKQSSKDGEIWRDDSFQFLLSPGNDNKTFHQFIVNPEGNSQSYHYVFDQVADTYINTKNLRADEWNVEVKKKADFWSAVFAIRKSFLDKYAGDSIHGLQILVDNSPSDGGMGTLTRTRISTQMSDAGVLRLLSKGKPASRPFPEPPALFFHKSKLLTGVPGDFEFRLACPAAKITGTNVKARDYYFLPNYPGSTGIQRFTIWNNETGCIFAGKTEPLIWKTAVPYGTRVLVPDPKKLEWSKDTLSAADLTIFCTDSVEKAVPVRLTEIWSGFFQTKLPCKAALLPDNTIVIGKMPSPAELPQVEKEEGYALSISGNGITIRGFDAPGLSHGVSTLEQLVRYAMLRNEDFLPGVTVTDWPDIPVRFLRHWYDACYWLPRKQFKPYADTFEEIEAGMYDSAYRFCILSKYNLLILRNPSQVIFETPDGKRMNRPTSHLTLQEFRDFAEFCRKYHLDIAPAAAGSSHANYLITNNFPEMILKGYGRGDADPTHPDYWKYLNAARGELIDALKPKYFHTCNDEWWHYPQGKIELTQNGRPRREIFLETILKEHDFITGKKKVRMLMCSDMLLPNHNGRKPYDNHLNKDKLPRDIIMLNWSGNEPGVKLLTDLGYTVWGFFNFSAMGKLNPAKIGHNPKFQGIGCTSSSDNPTYSFGCQSVITSAEEAWNFYSRKHTTMDDWLLENGAAVMPMYSVLPNPAATRCFTPISLPEVKPLPAPFTAVPGGRQTVGFIPMELNAGQGINTGVTPISINVNSKASALIFLQSELVTAKDPMIIQPRRTRWIQGLKSAIYTIHYADGKTLDIYSRHAVNNGSALPRRGKMVGEIPNRYLHDVRYLWQLKKGEAPFYLYQWEWVNPRPDVTIRSVSCRTLGNLVPGLEHYLFALTLRESNQTREK